jgi:hypothetical protein
MGKLKVTLTKDKIKKVPFRTLEVLEIGKYTHYGIDHFWLRVHDFYNEDSNLCSGINLTDGKVVMTNYEVEKVESELIISDLKKEIK